MDRYIEIAPDYYINSHQAVKFRLNYAPARGGYVWIFTLTTGKVLNSIPFPTPEEARIWLKENFEGLVEMSTAAREQHKGYRPE